MKKTYVSDLKIGESVFGEVFAVKSYSKKASRNNKPYIDIELADQTGFIKGKIWSDDMANCETVVEGNVVSVNATIDEYMGAPQIKITNLSKTDNYDIGDLQQTTQFDVTKMWGDVEKTINDIKNPHLKELLKNIFNQGFTDKFIKSPAAFKLHHAYAGGLLEHTWEMLDFAKDMKKHFPKLNMDLVNTGIILHDCGKVSELDISTAITQSDEGKLLGHIYLGTEVANKAKPKSMPQDLMNEVIHIILSHHGELQFGSPIYPKTVEAIVVNATDLASSKMNMAYAHINNSTGSEKYTQYVSQLNTELYRSPYSDDLENENIPF